MNHFVGSFDIDSLFKNKWIKQSFFQGLLKVTTIGTDYYLNGSYYKQIM